MSCVYFKGLLVREDAPLCNNGPEDAMEWYVFSLEDPVASFSEVAFSQLLVLSSYQKCSLINLVCHTK